MVGYATAYTMLPVFSLVLDRDVNEDVALLYPELYKELTKVGSRLVLCISEIERTSALTDVSTRLACFRLCRDGHCRTRPSSAGS